MFTTVWKFVVVCSYVRGLSAVVFWCPRGLNFLDKRQLVISGRVILWWHVGRGHEGKLCRVQLRDFTLASFERSIHFAHETLSCCPTRDSAFSVHHFYSSSCFHVCTWCTHSVVDSCALSLKHNSHWKENFTKKVDLNFCLSIGSCTTHTANTYSYWSLSLAH